ncbi:MAG: HAD family hydrolase [Promethearchaeota archaeon]
MKELAKPRKKLAIFDMDGTIVHFAIDWKAARLEVIEYLKSLSIPEDVLDIKNSILDLFSDAKSFGEARHREDIDWKVAGDTVYAMVEKYEVEAAVVSKPIDLVGETLQELKEAGIMMAVCTLNTSSNAEFVLNRHGFRQYFNMVAGRDVARGKVKPDPAHGQLILDTLGVSPENACMIGDHPADMDMASKLHVAGIAITSDRHGREAFSAFKGIRFIETGDYTFLARTIRELLG